MLSWSQKRQFLLIFAVLLASAAFFGVSVFLAWRKAPSCFDGEQNGGERGVDCGGSCVLLCSGEAAEPIVHFVRALPAGEGVWNAVAYVENRNKGAGASRVHYLFKLYDDKNLLVFERRGETFIPPRATFPIIEGGMRVPERVPTRATFEFLESPRFTVMEENPRLEIRQRIFSEEDGFSRLEVTLFNSTSVVLRNVEAEALLYDTTGNVFAASHTVIKELSPSVSTSATFTWQRVFPEAPARTEIFYQVPPQLVD